MLDNNFKRYSSKISHEEANINLLSDIEWFIINDESGNVSVLMPSYELVKYLSVDESDMPIEEQEQDKTGISLFEIPAKRLSLTPVSPQANLMKAHEDFIEDKITENSHIYGIITKKTIEKAYLPKTTKR